MADATWPVDRCYVCHGSGRTASNFHGAERRGLKWQWHVIATSMTTFAMSGDNAELEYWSWSSSATSQAGGRPRSTVGKCDGPCKGTRFSASSRHHPLKWFVVLPGSPRHRIPEVSSGKKSAKLSMFSSGYSPYFCQAPAMLLSISQSSSQSKKTRQGVIIALWHDLGEESEGPEGSRSSMTTSGDSFVAPNPKWQFYSMIKVKILQRTPSSSGCLSLPARDKMLEYLGVRKEEILTSKLPKLHFMSKHVF